MAAGILIPAPDGSGEIRIDGSRRYMRTLGIIELPKGSDQSTGTVVDDELTTGEFWYYFVCPGFTFWPALTVSGNTLTWDWQFIQTSEGVRLIYGVF